MNLIRRNPTKQAFWLFAALLAGGSISGAQHIGYAQSAHPINQPSLNAQPSERLSTTSLNESIFQKFKYYVSANYIGMTSANEMLIAIDLFPEGGKVFKVPSHSGKAIEVKLSGYLAPEGFRLSADGKVLFNHDDASDRRRDYEHDRCVHYLRAFSAADMALIRSADIGRVNDIHGFAPIPSEPSHVILGVTTLSPYAGSGIQVDDRLEFWDWKTKTQYHKIEYSHAHAINDALLSPDRKELACIFIDDELGKRGIVDFLNPTSGDILWHIRGDEKVPVDAPFFFLPDGRFVSKGSVYNLNTQSVAPLLPDHPGLRCVSEAGEATGLAFFQSKQGLELWDITKDILLKRWPEIANAGKVFLSPDGTILAAVCSPEVNHGVAVPFFRQAKIQFWKFDTKLLKH